MSTRVLCCLISFHVAVGVARADDVNAAREHFQRGSTAYDLGRFLDAAHEYEAAYEAKRDPNLLFNIGQAYRFVPDYAKAVLAFKAYLRNAPDHAPNRAEVESRIVEMQQRLQQHDQSAQRPAPTRALGPTPSPMPRATPSARTLLVAGGITAVVALALLATGGAFVAQTNDAAAAVNHPRPGTSFSPTLVDTLDRDQALEATFFAVGSAALITGAALAIVGGRRWRSERRLAWAPIVQPGAAGVVLAGAW
jgi:tetratricopeptide (TPR) repeat protein